MKINKICVIGIGYVGLPLAVKASKFYEIIGFDTNKRKIIELSKGYDETNYINIKNLKNLNINFTYSKKEIANCDLYIICVPTPVKKNNKPDLNYLKSALHTVNSICRHDSSVIIESTVYPGVSEKLFKSIFSKKKDVELCYSPERINPGDNKYTIENITKVISFKSNNNKEIVKFYNKITNNNTYIAKNIKTAEMAKALENTQRDINIALINEMTILCSKVGISIYDVLDTASTKWNFLKFTPGLVGGHCIPVDPYYLSEYAKQNNFVTKMILGGRYTNNKMVKFFKKEIYKNINNKKKNTILFLGITFKENVSDLRNSGTLKLIQELSKDTNFNLKLYDPLINKNELPVDVQKFYLSSIKNLKLDLLYLAVPHYKIIKNIKIILKNLKGDYKILDYFNNLKNLKDKIIIRL